MRNKTVFVAGGSTGINFRIAERFAEAGARVAIISRSADRTAAAEAALRDKGHEAIGIAADVREYLAVTTALTAATDRFGPIDAVVSGAAGNFIAPALGISSNGFRTVVDIDLVGTFNVARAAFDFLRKPGASIVNITAPQAVKPTMFQAHVCAAKAGVNMLTKVMAMEWGPAGVRVNAISPGPIADTEGMARLAPTAERERAIKSQLALRRYGTKDDIADAALFLCSDQARFITGAILDVDGGSLLGDARADAISCPEHTPVNISSGHGLGRTTV